MTFHTICSNLCWSDQYADNNDGRVQFDEFLEWWDAREAVVRAEAISYDQQNSQGTSAQMQHERPCVEQGSGLISSIR
jgi:hypothetical protein